MWDQSIKTDFVLTPLHRYRSITGYTLVDRADADFVRQWRWAKSTSYPYAIRYDYSGDKPVRYTLARVLMGLPPTVRDYIVDHINGNGLDNRRVNLRIATPSQNTQNRRKYRQQSSSKFRGVSYDSEKQRWRARGQLAGVTHHIGYFEHEDDAGAAAVEWRRLNMPFAVDR
jgi:hypothetical protein